MKTEWLPNVEKADYQSLNNRARKLLIVSEGFEERSVTFLTRCPPTTFDYVIVCKYIPQKQSKYKILMNLLCERHIVKRLEQINYNRHEPYYFELEMQEHISDPNLYDEIIVDISVMSKYLILQIMCLLSSYNGQLRIIYTEPMYYAPTKIQYKRQKLEQSAAILLPSYGVHDIVTTPLLSSIHMQKSPSLLVAFLSFNEQLVRVLLSECNPMRLLLVNGVAPHLIWREAATAELHSWTIMAHESDNPVDEAGIPLRRASTLYYDETLEMLAGIYRNNCVESRIILAPTGSKMQAIACAIMRICCNDIHIVYPTPESYYVPGFSSSKIRNVHQVLFRSFHQNILKVKSEYKLDQ